MQKSIFLLSALFCMMNARAQKETSLKYVDAHTLTVLGQAAAAKGTYQRVDSVFFSKLPKRVADLATNSAGICVSFQSNSKSISAKWTLHKYVNLWNMTPAAVNGMDLYGWRDGKWQYVASARPTSDTNQAALISNLDGKMRHYRLYLPLYSALTSLSIGIDSMATIEKAADNMLPKKKVVIYGSSITQGASASRPGMAYPSVLSRDINVETFNLGFSGSGKMELILADVLATMEADVYVLDCVPNCTPAEVRERAVPFIKRLRELKPGVPIIMVESIIREQSLWDENRGKQMTGQNNEFRKAYEQLNKEKYKDLYYVPATDLTGHDHEATIDGTHLTDLGFTRLAAVLRNTLQKVL
jgi:hypothetical protein